MHKPIGKMTKLDAVSLWSILCSHERNRRPCPTNTETLRWKKENISLREVRPFGPRGATGAHGRIHARGDKRSGNAPDPHPLHRSVPSSRMGRSAPDRLGKSVPRQDRGAGPDV